MSFSELSFSELSFGELSFCELGFCELSGHPASVTGHFVENLVHRKQALPLQHVDGNSVHRIAVPPNSSFTENLSPMTSIYM